MPAKKHSYSMVIRKKKFNRAKRFVSIEKFRKLEKEKNAVAAELDRVSAQLRRHKEFAKFPLTQLPNVVLLEIAEKLKLKARRALMQTCSKSRGLLYGRRTKGLDCRIRAMITGTFKMIDDDLHLTLTAQTKSEKKWEREWVIPAGAFLLPADVEETLTALERDFNCDELNFYVRRMRRADNFTAVMMSFVESATKLFPTRMTSCIWMPTFDDHTERMITLLLHSPRSISLCADFSHDSSFPLLTADRIVRRRAPLTTMVKAAAVLREIPVTFEESGPDVEHVFLFDVKENSKSLTISGAMM